MVILLPAISFGAVLDTGNAIVDDFFKRDPDKELISREGVRQYEYGFKIDHGSWSEERYWFGKNELEAMGAFISATN